MAVITTAANKSNNAVGSRSYGWFYTICSRSFRGKSEGKDEGEDKYRGEDEGVAIGVDSGDCTNRFIVGKRSISTSIYSVSRPSVRHRFGGKTITVIPSPWRGTEAIGATGGSSSAYLVFRGISNSHSTWLYRYTRPLGISMR